MSIRALSSFVCLMALSIALPIHAAQTQPEKKTEPSQSIQPPEAAAQANLPEQKEEAIKPPFITNASITGQYYFAYENLIRDVYITTPVNNKFYFKAFIAQTPINGAMSAQYYNEVDGVATFNEKGIGIFHSPYKNCDLYFIFKPPRLTIEQDQDCGMASEFGLEVSANYKQIETF